LGEQPVILNGDLSGRRKERPPSVQPTSGGGEVGRLLWGAKNPETDAATLREEERGPPLSLSGQGREEEAGQNIV
jgi:hypothetical protein